MSLRIEKYRYNKEGGILKPEIGPVNLSITFLRNVYLCHNYLENKMIGYGKISTTRDRESPLLKERRVLKAS